jgi:ankyrin repeat protein
MLASTAVHNQKSHFLSTSTSDDYFSSDITVNDVNVKGKYGVTPLMLAAHGNHWRTVDELLRLGARPDMVDRNRATALIYALTTVVVNEPCLAIVKTLIRYNASVDEPCNLKSFCNTMDLPCHVIR